MSFASLTLWYNPGMSFLSRNNIEALIRAAGITREDMLEASRDPKYANQVARRLLKQGEEVAKEVANTAIGLVAQQVREYLMPDPVPPASVGPSGGWTGDEPLGEEDLGDALRDSLDRMAAYDTLGLDFDPGEIVPLNIAESIYKAMAFQKHPDRGGTTSEMQDLNKAIEYIREEHRRKQRNGS